MERQTKKQVKDYYIKQLEIFFSKTTDISDEDMKGLPAIHIPCLGFTDEMPEIAFYGMETNGWHSMKDFRKMFQENPSKAYDYITTAWFCPASVIKSAQPRKHIFWKYVISLMSRMYGLSPKELKTENALKKHTLIWGNILSLERFHVSAKHNGANKEIYNKLYKESSLFNTLPNGHWGPTYIVKACQPKFLFILYSGFNMRNWLRNDFGIERELIHKHLGYAYIKETDTYVFKMPHPRFIFQRLGWEKTIKQVLERLELNKQMLEGKNGA